MFNLKKLKLLHKRASIYSGWITPQGEVVPAEAMSHAETFIEFIGDKISKEERKELKQKGDSFFSNDLIIRHYYWIRFLFTGYQISFDMDLINERNLKQIEIFLQNNLNLLEQAKHIHLYSCVSGQSVEFPVEKFKNNNFNLRDLFSVHAFNLSRMKKQAINQTN